MFPANETRGQSAVSSRQEYTELGVPGEWVAVLQELGYTTIEKLKEVEKPGKLSLWNPAGTEYSWYYFTGLANDLNGYNKKNKLGLKGLGPEMVSEWLL